MAGETIIVSGDTVRIEFESNDSSNDFGYQITDISPLTSQEYDNTSAKNVVYESSHPYKNDRWDFWDYTYDGEAAALAVTFSEETRTQQDRDFVRIFARLSNEHYGKYGKNYGFYSGASLAGRTVVIPGNELLIMFLTDGEGTDFGFQITDISPLTSQEYEDFLSVEDNVYFMDENLSQLVWYSGGKTHINVPAAVNGQPIKSIGVDALAHKALVSVTLPEGIEFLSAYAFQLDPYLEEVVLPNSLRSIGTACFKECTSLKELRIPDNVESIGDHAFAICSDLEKVIIPDSVTQIGSDAFFMCSKVTIYANEGSYAEQYAKENNIPFAALESDVDESQPTVSDSASSNDASSSHASVSKTNPSTGSRAPWTDYIYLALLGAGFLTVTALRRRKLRRSVK
ncbi:leucine-rich repeat protein [Candidatus Soleaferrea massiliensis]|uniref:leucine-rich repeat protein n=1 Tax=Candidatus Soleaferrea massiliensis TaxID=1470354 RepID=UPI0018CFD660|nr:leucine-rich repeat protein [Candidatus Soleaferrea massiliensis]